MAIANDRASAPLLRTLLVDREVMVREAARKALAAMRIPEKPSPPVRAPATAASHRTGVRARMPSLWLGAIVVLILLFVGAKGARSYRR